MTTYADFQVRIRRALEESSADVWADADLMYWTNETARDMSTRVRQNIEETYTNTVSGTADYELPENTQEIVAVYFGHLTGVDDGKLLERESPQSRWTVPSDTGTPEYYQRMDEVLRLRPIPDSVAELLIRRKVYPTAITSSDDDMPFRSERDTCIGYGVLERAFEQIGDWQSADAYKARYMDALMAYDMDSNIASDAGVSSFPVETY